VEKRKTLTAGRTKAVCFYLEVIDTMTRVVSQVTIIVATELTIQWNKITDVYTLKSAGQTIPLIVGGGLMVRVF
jgi:hypothetical protein